MNLFNPKGQKNLGVDFTTKQLTESNYINVNERSVDKIRSIFNDEGGKGKIRNPDLQSKTAAIQKEFETLMADMVQRRGGNGYSANAMNNLEEMLDGYYLPGPERKHKSPTRRLINHKNSITEHKQRVQSGLQRGTYSQIYSVAPGNTYVIEAQGGELPYEMADKNP